MATATPTRNSFRPTGAEPGSAEDLDQLKDLRRDTTKAMRKLMDSVADDWDEETRPSLVVNVTAQMPQKEPEPPKSESISPVAKGVVAILNTIPPAWRIVGLLALIAAGAYLGLMIL
jgi:hypothetical protein